MKRVEKFRWLLALVLTILLLVVMLCQTAFAANAVSVSNVTVEKAAYSKYVTLEFDFTCGGKDYYTFITGIRPEGSGNDWAKPMAQALAEAFSKESPLKIVNRGTSGKGVYAETRIDLVDAEKQNLEENGEWGSASYYENTDAGLCWAAATSNMLQISGWGKAAMELHPEAGLVLNNEDEIFTFFINGFNDAGGMADNGSQWFLNGVNGYQQVKDDGTVLYYDHLTGNSQQKREGIGGYAKEYCGQVLVESLYELNPSAFTDYVTMENLMKGADRLQSGYGVGMGIESSTFAHDLTMTGVVREMSNGKPGEVCAIVLADSDNDAPAYKYNDTAAAAAAGSRIDRVNSFSMYPVKWFEEDQCEYSPYPGIYIKDYWHSNLPGYEMMITNLYAVAPYGSGLPTETEGTRDATTSPDLLVNKVKVCTQPYHSFEDELLTGIQYNIYAELKNNSYAMLTDEGNATVTVRIHVLFDGTETDVFTVTRNTSAVGRMAKNCDISRPYTFAKPGIYRMYAQILSVSDAKGKIREAYTDNNVSAVCSFLVVENQKPTPTPPPVVPPTGDGAPVMGWIGMMLMAGLGLALLLKRKERVG